MRFIAAKAALAPGFAVKRLTGQLAGAAVVVAALATCRGRRSGTQVSRRGRSCGPAPALGLGARGGGLGGGTVGRRWRGVLGAGLARTSAFSFHAARPRRRALVFLGLQAQGFLAFAFLAFLGLDLFAAALRVLLAGLFLGLALRGFLGLAALAAFSAARRRSISASEMPAGRLTVADTTEPEPVRHLLAAPVFARHDDALALGLDDHVCPAVAEALLHLPEQSRQDPGVSFRRYRSSDLHSFPAEIPPSCPRRPVSLLASLINLSVQAPGASALCMT